MIEYRLLGPFEVAVDGVPVELSAGKPRALLARLTLEHGRVVSAAALVDALWFEPPASAAKLVQVYVSQVRKALGADAVETVAPGYRLAAAHGATDLTAFEELTRRAEGTGRAELLTEALSLWRGPALAEFRDEPFAAVAARRLDELRLVAQEEWAYALLERGEEARAIPELQAIAAEHPLRERPLRQLMLALYRAGRQAEALAAYREARRRTVGELGIEPGPALQELERAILRHEVDRAPASVGRIFVVGAALAPLFGPLARGGRELVLLEIAVAENLGEHSAELADAARVHGGRSAAFTSSRPAEDLARLAADQAAELLVVAQPLSPDAVAALVAAVPCTLALVPRQRPFVADAPVLVPFAGDADEWPALELAAWIAHAHDLPLRLLGTEATGERRDASRLLASASLALQRFSGTSAEPALVARGAEGILGERGSVVVTSLPEVELDATRRALVERSEVPVLLVRGGLRSGSLAPERTLTRFGWTLQD